MRNKDKFVGIFIIILILLVSLSFISFELYESYKKRNYCFLCEREIIPSNAFIIELKGGKKLRTCCPRCGLRYFEKNKSKIERMYATDFISLEVIDAFKAYYVIGSEYHGCCRRSVMIDSNKRIYDLCYDRCMPTLVAFKKKNDAKEFMKKYGGDYFNLSSKAR